MKKVVSFIIVIIVIALVGVGYWQFKAKKKASDWRTFITSRTTITQTITSIGTVDPITQVDIGTEVSGKIEKLYKDFNDPVKKGELLAKLDTETLEMSLEESKIDRNRSRLTVENNLDDLENKQELFEQEMISEYELKQAQYTYNLSVENLARSEFSVQRAQKNLNNAYIYSPIDGVVTSRNVDEGQTVAASLNAPTLFIIANKLEEMQIEAYIDEADIGKVKEGLPVRFTVDAFANKRFSGTISQVRLNPTSEQNVITYPVIISIQNPDTILLPGMTANLDIIISEHPNVIAIQERALQFKPTQEIWESMGLDYTKIQTAPSVKRGSAPDQAPAANRPPEGMRGQGRRKAMEQGSEQAKYRTAQIWILENGIPKQINIQVGESDGTYIEVASGLEENTEVIIGINYVKSTGNTSSAFSSGMQPRRF